MHRGHGRRFFCDDGIGKNIVIKSETVSFVNVYLINQPISTSWIKVSLVVENTESIANNISINFTQAIYTYNQYQMNFKFYE